MINFIPPFLSCHPIDTMMPIVFIAYWFLACVFSLEECGRYLETIKVYENKPADLIQGQMDMDYLSRV